MCDRLNRLQELQYLSNDQVYLQKHEVQTNLPDELRTASYCMYCDGPSKDHELATNDKCLGYKTGINNRYFVPTSDRQDKYRINLVTVDEYSNYKEGDENFPEPTHLSYCPYCGFEDEIKS